MRKCFGRVSWKPTCSNENNLERAKSVHRLNLMQKVFAKFFEILYEQEG